LGQAALDGDILGIQFLAYTDSKVVIAREADKFDQAHL
jgi:hypothetical protein